MSIYLTFDESNVSEFEVEWSLFRRGINFVGRYVDSIIIEFCEYAYSHGYHSVLFDVMGEWFNIDLGVGDVSRYLFGVDIPANIFLPPPGLDKYFYFELVADYLDVVAGNLGYRVSGWKPLFIDLLISVYESEGTINNEILSSRVEILRNEASGYDKVVYNWLAGLLRYLIYSSDVKRLYYVDEPIKYEYVVGDASLIDYSAIKGFYQRLLPYIATLFTSLVYDFKRLNIFFLGELYLENPAPSMVNVLLKSYSYLINLIHFSYYKSNLFSYLPAYNLFVDNSFVDRILKYYGFDRIKFIDASTHHYISLGRFLPISVDRELNELKTNFSSDVSVDESYAPDKSLVKRILLIVRDLGSVGVEGIYMYLREYGRGDVYMAVEWMWREGLLKRSRFGRGYVYKISIKGLMWLKEGGDDG